MCYFAARKLSSLVQKFSSESPFCLPWPHPFYVWRMSGLVARACYFCNAMQCKKCKCDIQINIDRTWVKTILSHPLGNFVASTFDVAQPYQRLDHKLQATILHSGCPPVGTTWGCSCKIIKNPILIRITSNFLCNIRTCIQYKCMYQEKLLKWRVFLTF